ncbi:MAG: hypothetical protein H6R14_799 [Proteobacteria bacterium]|nr:hypothetical protein [Pseudomonadota bacterium]
MPTQRFRHPAGAFEITSLPGQPQVAICHSFFVRETDRGRGKSHEIKAQQRHTLQSLQYDYAVCTVSGNNHAQKAVLSQGGWKKLTEFYNHRNAEFTETWGTTP